MRVIDNMAFNELPRGTVFYKNGFFGVKTNRMIGNSGNNFAAICVLPEWASKAGRTAGINTSQHVSAELNDDGSSIFVYETGDIQYLLNALNYALTLSPLPQTGQLPAEMTPACAQATKLIDELETNGEDNG